METHHMIGQSQFAQYQAYQHSLLLQQTNGSTIDNQGNHIDPSNGFYSLGGISSEVYHGSAYPSHLNAMPNIETGGAHMTAAYSTGHDPNAYNGYSSVAVAPQYTSVAAPTYSNPFAASPGYQIPLDHLSGQAGYVYWGTNRPLELVEDAKSSSDDDG